MEYRVIYEFDKETGQVIATVPSLNYVSSFGADFAEAERNIQEAVEAYLEALVKEGQSLPLVPEERVHFSTSETSASLLLGAKHDR
jgi:predicted RNase H-like HicB family nuclease